jgi:tRNA nucleotidyltransferase (CCA-adding enzyme)
MDRYYSQKELVLQVVILGEGADLDALSSAYGITLLYDDTYILLPNSLTTSVRFILKRYKHKFKNKLIKLEDIKNLEKIFLVDTNNVSILEKKYPKLLNKKIKIEIFDHHPKITQFGKNFILHIDSVGAATTLVIEEIQKKGTKIDSKDATILAFGLYEDTGSFTYNMTTERDFYAGAFLIKNGADLNLVRYLIEEKIDEDKIRIIEQLIENIHILYVQDKKIIITSAYYDKYVPDISSSFHIIKPFEEADAVFAVINLRGKITIIARSKTKKIHTGKILSIFGGGGHYAAASANIKGLTTNEIIKILEEILLKQSYSELKIEKIMSRDILIKNKSSKIRDIKDEIKKYPLIIIVDENQIFEGIVLQKVIKDALKHGLEDSPLENFLIDNIITLTPEMSVIEAEELLIKYSQEYFPVVKKGYPVGLISRIQILKSVHGSIFETEKDIFISRTKVIPKYVDYRKKLERYLPSEILEELRFIGKIAKKIGYRVYLVGGIVRDIVMKRKNLDIDLIVEGDAIALVREYAKRRNLPFSVFEEFMTANVKLPNGIKLDFATARKETYERPGSYPKVEKASLKEDLYRRDFTINTLAIEITEDKFGVLIDYFKGLRDIKDKTIRILHQLSFVEDPIRILRALRFAGRFGFKLGKTTEKLLKFAVDQNLLLTAPTGRINLEFNLTFNEEKVVDIIFLMNKYKVLHQLIPEFILDEKRESILYRLRDLIISFQLFLKFKIDKVSIYLLALMYHLPLEISSEILEKYHFKGSIKFFEEYFDKKDIFKTIPEKNSSLYKKIKFIDKNLLIYFCGTLDMEISDRIIQILKKEEERKLIISGEDLNKLGIKPSPIYKVILDDVFKKFLDDEIKTKEEAVNYVKQKYLTEISQSD